MSHAPAWRRRSARPGRSACTIITIEDAPTSSTSPAALAASKTWPGVHQGGKTPTRAVAEEGSAATATSKPTTAVEAASTAASTKRLRCVGYWRSRTSRSDKALALRLPAISVG